jgi:hypothetical protein
MRTVRRHVAALIALATATGCVERRFIVTSDPPGATVLRNHQALGFAPADDHFVYYGNYHFTLVKDGFETLQVDQNIPTPWYEYFPLDFFSENLVPWKIQDVRRFHYHMEPVRAANTSELLDRAQELRTRGQAIGAPAAPQPVPPALPAPPPGPPG